MNGIEISSLRKEFPDRVLFSSLSLRLPRRGFFALHGSSGSGKSTLLDIVAGLEQKDGGRVLLMGREVGAGYPDRLLDVGYLRQSYDLIEEESALNNVSVFFEASGHKRREGKRRAISLLRALGLRGKERRKCRDLSGGEKARVALARALVNDPPVVLADEPTGALDEKNARGIYSLLRKISSSRLVFMVSHDEERATPYLDGAYRLADGKAEGLFFLERRGETTHRLPRGHRKVTAKILLSLAKRRMESRKFETAFFLFVLVFSLTSIGISSYVSDALPEALSSSFSLLTGRDEIVVRPREIPDSVSTYLPSRDGLASLVSFLDDDLSSIGVSYVAPWESLFPERNEAAVSFKNREWIVPGLGARGINDYLLAEEAESTAFFPSKPEVMEDDQIVLGLPEREMNEMALAYNLSRSYGAVGNFLTNEPIELLFSFENDGWGYEDEQLLEIVAVAKTEKVCLIHRSNSWSETILEGRMRLPSYQEEGVSSEPWALYKVPYLLPKADPTALISRLRDDPRLEGYLFARSNDELNRTFSRRDGPTDLKRVYVYALSASYLEPRDLSTIARREEIAGVSYLGGSYLALPEAMASGFAEPFFLSPSESLLIEAVEGLPSYDLEGGRPFPSPLEGIETGYVLLPRSDGIVLKSGGVPIEGRAPETIDEIGLSKSLYQALGCPDTVYAAGYRESEGLGEGRVKDAYSVVPLSVTGVYGGEGREMVTVPYWSVDFFRDRIGRDAFSLLISSAVLFLEEGTDGSFLPYLRAKYPLLDFIDVSEAVEGGISEALSYMEALFSLLVVFSSLVALLAVVAVAVSGAERSRKEGEGLYLSGFQKDEVSLRDFLSLALPLFLSFCLSLASTFLLEIVMSVVLSSAFAFPLSIRIETRPFLEVALFAALSLFAMALAFSIKGRRRDFSRRSRR